MMARFFTRLPADPELRTPAHVLPLAVFMGFMLVLQFATMLIGWKHPDAPWWRQDPAHFIYPLQSLAAAWVLWRYWRLFEFNWSLKWGLIGAAAGAVGIGFWLLPTTLYDALGFTGETEGWLARLGVAARKEGFDPGIFEHPAAYAATLAMRFFRAVVIVALAEEIFWRGFLMRFVCDWEGDYWRQPFGRATWRSYLVVTAVFMVAHAPVDYAGAWVYGSLTYLVCVWSKNLGACVIMHAVANLLMGCYARAYVNYGLW